MTKINSRIWESRNVTMITAIGIIVFLFCYLFIIRPWQLRWGATDDEVSATMPGDAVILRPTFNATRAVMINAPPESIWPWILQIGHKRAGWYSYDWIDNLGKPSAREILPEFQQIEIGSLIPISPNDKLGFRVKDYKPMEWILWWYNKGDTTWCWGLYPIDEHNTRLITRVRVRYKLFSLLLPFYILLDIGDIMMMRKCLLGIKERAELLEQEHNRENRL